MPRTMSFGLGLDKRLGSRNWTAQSNESKLLFARMSVKPTSARKILIDNLITSLKSSGLWDRLDVLQVYACHNEADSLLNWKADAINASKISTPAFEVDRGFTSATGKGIDTGFNPVTLGSNYKVDDYSWGVYSRTNSTSTSRDAGHNDAITGSLMRVRNLSDQASYCGYRSNLTLTNSLINVITSSLGLFSVSKSTSTRSELWQNGVSKVNDSVASGSMISNNMYVGFQNTNGSPGSASLRQYAYYYAGDSFNSTELQSLFALMENYLLNIGAGFFLI